MNIKFIASGVGFTSLGAILAWAVTADSAERKFRRMGEDYISMMDDVKSKTARIIQLEQKVVDQRVELEELSSSIEQNENLFDENSPEEDLQEIVSGGEIEEVHTETAEEAIARSKLQELINQYAGPEHNAEYQARQVIASTKYDPPFVISKELFAWDEDEGDDYAKIELKYYPKQQVLLDEDDEPVEDIEGYIGYQSLRRFGDDSGHSNLVYVRNRRLETDFQVELEEDSELPLHVKYALPKVEFNAQRAAGKIRLKELDE